MDKNNIYVAIMAGGIGSRFWPMSRVERPKQFLDILGTGRSLLQLTYDRFIEIAPKKNIFVVTNEAYRELTKEQLPGLSDEQIMGEPFRRNTAPCVAWVSNKIANLNPNANMIVSPADHLILKEDAFKEKMIQGLEFVNSKDCLITLGIKPTRPDTGYGYIQYLEEKEEHGVYKVKTFTEKPTLEIAKSFLESGDFLWNSGMFIWSTRSIIKAFKKYLPEIGEVFEDGKKIYNTEKEKEFISKAYELCKNISIDYGVMEKANNVSVIPADLGWSDLGNWSSLYENSQRDYLGNAVYGANVMIYDSNNNMVIASKDRLMVLQGLEDYIVIDTEDALLICHRSNEQMIKEIQADIKRKNGDDYL